LLNPNSNQTSRKKLRCHINEVKQQRVAPTLFYFIDTAAQNSLNPTLISLRCCRLIQRQPNILLDKVFQQAQHGLLRSRYQGDLGWDLNVSIQAILITMRAYFLIYSRMGNSSGAVTYRGERSSVTSERMMADAVTTMTTQLASISKTTLPKLFKISHD
jgi:hypothetical protein